VRSGSGNAAHRRFAPAGLLGRLALLLALGALVCAGCASVGRGADLGSRVTLPASPGWYAGKKLYYVTTEITDPTMAKNAGYTFAPRLGDAVPVYPRPPGVRTVLERVYKSPNGEQDAVFASAPNPPGPASTDMAYSPYMDAPNLARFSVRDDSQG
jgi:hypothetical protein